MALVGLSVCTGCGSDAPPTVSIVADPGSFTTGEQTVLTVTVTNFDLVDPTGSAPVEHDHSQSTADGLLTREGHYHVYLDSTDVNPLAMAWSPVLRLAVEAEPGPHRLIVRLNANDHRFLQPEIRDIADIMLVAE